MIEAKDAYDLMLYAQNKIRQGLKNKIEKAISFERARDIKKDNWSKKQQDAYIKGMECIYNLH